MNKNFITNYLKKVAMLLLLFTSISMGNLEAQCPFDCMGSGDPAQRFLCVDIPGFVSPAVLSDGSVLLNPGDDGYTAGQTCYLAPYGSCGGATRDGFNAALAAAFATSPPVCPGDDPCLEYFFDVEACACDSRPIPDFCTQTTMLPCDDGNPCTIGTMQAISICDNSVCGPCTGGTTFDCSTGPTTLQACNDGNPCTLNDVETILNCDGSICIPCAGTPVDICANAVFVPCDDGDPCTTHDKESIENCDGSICVPCAGEPIGDCMFTITMPCDDGDPCTTGDVQVIQDCDNSVCVPCGGTPITETKICTSEANWCRGETNSTTVLVCQECPDLQPPPCPDCNVTCPPCSRPDPDDGCKCKGIETSDECYPFACNDGDPCTANDVEFRDCSGQVCVPCQGEERKITTVEVKNMRDCGEGLCGPGKFTADICICFNYGPVYDDFIITGDVYFSFKEQYCEYNGNCITVRDQCFDADGEKIKLNVIFNSKLVCSAKRVKAGKALSCAKSHRVAQTNFNAFKQDRQVDLEWITNETYKSSKYIIEKSVDGINFTQLKEVANTELSEDLEYFNSLDETPVYGDNFYRLQQVFTDGTSTYSDIQVVNFGVDLDALNFFPNPAENELYLDLDEFVGRSGHMIISNKLGQVMEEMTFDAIPSDLIKVDFSNYINGIYIVRTKIENSEYVAKKVIVSKLY